MTTGFDAYDNAVAIARAMRGLCEAIREHDRSLADQARRATQSIGLDVAEARKRTKGDRTHAFAIALGSANETRAALELAEAWGYVPAPDAAEALALLDREVAMLWRLSG